MKAPQITVKIPLMGLTAITSLNLLFTPPMIATIPNDTSPNLSNLANSRTNKSQLSQEIDLYNLYPANSRSCILSTVSQAISPDGKLLAISSHDYERSCGSGTSTLTLWDVAKGTKITTLMQGKATEAFFIEEEQTQEPIEGNTNIAGDIVRGVIFTPDNKQLIGGLSNGNVQIWDLKTGKVVQTLRGHRYAIHAIALSSDGKILVSGSSDQTLKLWDLNTGKLLHTLNLNSHNGIINRLIISSNNQILVSATTTNQIQLWNLATGSLIKTIFNSDQSPEVINPIALSPDGKLLATGDQDHSVKLWNSNTGTRFLTLKGHKHKIESLAFNPNSKTLISSSKDNTIKFWKLETNTLENTLTNVGVSSQFNHSPVGRITFNPNGNLLAIEALINTSDNIPRMGLKIWDLTQKKFILEIPEIFSHPGINFSPNGQLLIAVAPKTKIWRLLK